MILPVVSYGYEILSLTIKDEHGLMVFENRALGNIFGPKMEEVNRDLRKLHNEELKDLCSSQSCHQINLNETSGARAMNR
jgi:hypothetical protein